MNRSIVRRVVLLVLKLGVLVGMLALAVVTQDLHQIWLLVAGANLYSLLLFIALHAAIVALSSSNLYLLLRPLGKRLRWRRFFYFELLSLVGVYYTPGGIVGLGGVIYMMSRDGVGLKDSTVTVLANKGIMLIAAVLFLAIYLGVYFSGELVVIWYGLVVLVLVTVLGMVAIFASVWARQTVAKIIDRVRCYRGHYLLFTANAVITIGLFALSALQIIGCLSAVGIEVKDYWLIFFSYGALPLINQLPITFGGLGVGEAAAVFLWSELGAPSEQILAAFILMRIFTLVSTMLLSGGAMVAWLLEQRRARIE